MSQTVEPPAEDIAQQPAHTDAHTAAQPSEQRADSEAMDSGADMSDDELAGRSLKSWQARDMTSPGSTKSSTDQSPIKLENASGSATEVPSMPSQKRRRVTRACDECRRKKIKCDGKQPCTHCSVYSYECTYDKPSNRRRNPAPQYIEALEHRLQRAEMLLRKVMPDVDLSDPSLEPAVQQEFQNRERARTQAAKLKRDEEQRDSNNQGAQIMSMIETIGHLDLSDGGEVDFHGISSGAVFLGRMKEHFHMRLGLDCRHSLFKNAPRPPGMLNLDTPLSAGSSPWDSSGAPPGLYALPPREHARNLCNLSITCATCLLRIVHTPSFFETFHRLYQKQPDSFGSEDHRSLALLYSVMALGTMYNISEEGGANPSDYKAAMAEGMTYYTNARHLLQDITECRDLVSLQALLFMILFLQASSNLGACYSFVGIALRAALRMGLHRHIPHAKLTPIEHETRRRVFYVVRQMDTYISALLGFPILLNDEDIDQPLPTEVDDEYITKEAIMKPPAGTPSFFEAFNAHLRLMGILAKVIKHIYPRKGIEDCVLQGDRANTTYMISYPKIKEIECELHDWYEKLPAHWRPNPEGPVEYVRVRTLLRFAYAHVQMMLYRPFLHYISPRIAAGKNVDERHYACAAAGISVSRNIVHIGMEIRKQTVLAGPYWFILYTEFFAILALVFFALENPDKPGASEIFDDATAGRDVIASLSYRSLAADRVTDALGTLFDQLSDRFKTANPRPVPTKKRSAPVPKLNTIPMQPQARRSEDMGRAQPGHEVLRQIPHRMSFDGAQRQQNGHPPQLFASRFPDLLPLELSPHSGSPESSGTPSTSHPSATGFQGQPTPASAAANHLYKLDAMMFPSADPFAYPNQPQPVLDFNMQQQARHASAGQPPDGMQYYMPNAYDDIEGQLMGPIPPYLMQHSQGQGMGMSHNMYDSGPNMLSLQQAQAGQAQQSAHHHQQQRELEEFLADPSFDMFPQNYRQI